MEIQNLPIGTVSTSKPEQALAQAGKSIFVGALNASQHGKANQLSDFGLTRLRAGAFAEAEGIFREALRVGGGDTAVITNRLGVAIKKQGRIEESVALWQPMADAGFGPAQYNMGTAHALRFAETRDLKDLKLALQNLNSAIDYNPTAMLPNAKSDGDFASLRALVAGDWDPKRQLAQLDLNLGDSFD